MTGSVLLWYPPVPSCCSAICWPYLLGIYLSCYHVALMYSSFQSTCLLIKISFIFCQAVILNKNMGCDWPPLFDWQMVCKLYYLYCFLPDRVISRQISKKPAHLIGHPSPTFNLPFWTPRHTHIYTWHPCTDQQIRGSMLNLSVAEEEKKKSLGHHWRLFWKALSWKAFWDDSRPTEIAPVEERASDAQRVHKAHEYACTHTRTNTRHRKDL